MMKRNFLFFVFVSIVVNGLWGATYTVTSNADDSGSSTLRTLITNASDGDIIQFNISDDNGGNKDMIVISSEISIDKTITINGVNTATDNNITVKVAVTNAEYEANTSLTVSDFRVFNINASGKTVTISNMIIKGGNVEFSSPSNGGAILHTAGTLDLENVEVSDAKANNGGGIYNIGSLTVSSSAISGNLAVSSGGAINNSGTITLSSSTISNNTALDGGGIYNNSTMTINFSTIGGNTTSSGDGGGIYNSHTLTLNSSTISGNTALNSSCGGIVNGLFLTVVSSTISDNAAGDIGGIGNFYNTDLLNSIIINNTASSEADYYSDGTTNAYYCWSSFTAYSAGSNNISDVYDSDLGVLADNGGSTQTMALNTSAPAAEAGCWTGTYDDGGTIKYAYASTYDAAVWTKLEGGTVNLGDVTPVTTDQRGSGYYRTATPDIGAFESNSSDVPLSISLIDFSAIVKQNAVELTWNTASETNNALFLIYRNDKVIVSLEGAGTTSETHHYAFTDNTVIPGESYTYVIADVNYANNEIKHIEKAITLIIPENDIPKVFALKNNYPNPFNPATTIGFQLSTYDLVEISIYDMSGKKVKTLISDNVPAGYHEVNWDASDYASGIYFYRLKAGGFVETKKMVLMK